MPPVVIGEPHASPTQLPSQHPILFDQVRQDLPLPAIQPAGDGEEQYLERRDVDHERELTAQPKSSVRNLVGSDVGHYAVDPIASYLEQSQ